MLTVRPKVAELTIQLYGRPLHPELFEVCSSRVVERGGYRAKIDITSTGHVITWRHEGLTLTELITSSHHPLPEKRRLMSYRLKGERHDFVECRGGAMYDVRFQIQALPPERFWSFQQQFTTDDFHQGLLQRFDASGRMALGALSYVHTELRDAALMVRAFHTFPDDYAIVTVRSIFRIPKAPRGEKP